MYIAVNSGARMGLATEVLKLFRVEWIDESQPSRGFKYLYVREKDYQTLMQTDSIVAEPVQHPVEGKVSSSLASHHTPCQSAALARVGGAGSVATALIFFSGNHRPQPRGTPLTEAYKAFADLV